MSTNTMQNKILRIGTPAVVVLLAALFGALLLRDTTVKAEAAHIAERFVLSDDAAEDAGELRALLIQACQPRSASRLKPRLPRGRSPIGKASTERLHVSELLTATHLNARQRITPVRRNVDCARSTVYEAISAHWNGPASSM
jgi:hypothetical protein